VKPLALLLALFLLASPFCSAGSATWNLNPASNDWNTATNWTPTTVPNGAADTATFGASNITNVTNVTPRNQSTTLDGIVFSPGASAFTITTLVESTPASPQGIVFSGIGVTNNSGVTQNFVSANFATLLFQNHASAGRGTVFTVAGDLVSGGDQHGFITFTDDSTAGDGTFIVEGGTGGGFGGVIDFMPSSSAANGTFIVNGPNDADSYGGYVAINGPGLSRDLDPTAGHGTFIVNGGGPDSEEGGDITVVYARGGNAVFTINGGNGQDAAPGTIMVEFANPENATFIANGGQNGGGGGDIQFWFYVKPSQARVELFGNGQLDIGRVSAPGLVIGSLAGNGNVFLGGNALAIDKNERRTTFSGVIQDGGAFGGTGGSLTKLGRGQLTLSGASLYTGGTTLTQGTLVVANTVGSATGSGAVQVSGGKLSGTGSISGAVTIGAAGSPKAALSPGMSATGTLTIGGTLHFTTEGTYQFAWDSTKVTSSSVIANGVTIDSAQFAPQETNSGVLPIGTTFTGIYNTAATPITGAFANLPDGGTITVGSNTFQANYEGGDGNDLTLTVVP
jgi:autotransporter-associated beta strand protein